MRARCTNGANRSSASRASSVGTRSSTPRGNVSSPDEPASSSEEEWAVYLRRAAPVRSHAEARTPEGIYHMYGNVAEYTESMALSLVTREDLIVLSLARFTCGGWWDIATRGWPMRFPGMHGIGPSENTWYTGFRCAKSASP